MAMNASRLKVLFFSMILACFSLNAQTKKNVIEEPQFPGGRKELLEYIEKNMVIPDDLQRLGIEGEVVVEFFVERSGVISGVNVVKSIHQQYDNEAIRLVRNMPRWIPGKRDGFPVRYHMTMPINFKVSAKLGRKVKETNKRRIKK